VLRYSLYTALTAGALSFDYLGCLSPVNPPPVKENQKPVAVLTASPMSGYAPLNVTFDASASHDPDGDTLKFIYFPKFPKDTVSVTGQNKINYTYSDTGTYRPRVIVEDIYRARDTASVLENIVVGKTPNQKPVAQFTLDKKTGYAPLTVTADGSSSYDVDGTIEKGFWDYENDGIIDDSSNVIIKPTYQNPGNYTLSYFVRDNEGALSDKKLENIVVDSLIVPPQPGDCPFFSWQCDGDAILENWFYAACCS